MVTAKKVRVKPVTVCASDRDIQSEKIDRYIIHQTDGRIRIKIPKLAIDRDYADRLHHLVEQLEFITDVRINLSSRSIAVQYKSLQDSRYIQSQILDCIPAASLLPENRVRVGILDRQNPDPITLESTIGYQVKHRNDRYLRIQIPYLADNPEYASNLQYLVESITHSLNVKINPITRSVAVEFDQQVDLGSIAIAEQQLLTAIQQAADVNFDPTSIPKSESSSHAEIDYWERLGLPALGLVLSLGVWVGVPLPGVVTGGVIIAATIPVFKRAWEGIQEERQLNIDFLDGLAISLHTLQASYFAPALMLGLIEGGEVIRDMTARGTQRASLDLLDCLGKYALVDRDGQELQILVKDVIIGDRVVVYPGDQIPVDGFILSGTGIVDQCKLTGESIPVTRSLGDEVFASTLLVDGNLCILAERTGNNTRAGVIVSLMQAAPVHDTRTENYAAMVANQMVVPTLVTAGAVGLFSGDINRTIALLTLDLGTGIRVSVPTTILSALTYAARSGVLIRSGRTIELLAKVDTIVFDKTGTLTQGHAGITEIKLTQSEFTDLEILALAATAEQGLTHPVAEAIVRHARNIGVSLHECEDWEYQVGLGVSAKIQGQQILVGSKRLMNQAQIDLEPIEQSFPELGSTSNSVVYVAGDGRLLGTILYSDPPRPESQGVIQDLQRQGIDPYMLSGDMKQVARNVAQELGMNPNHVYAEAFPERKVEVVQELHDRGRTVAFCGDGINDSAALAYADVSISFAGATDIARETADVVLMQNDLRGLTHAIRVAKHAMEIIEQNISLVAIPNISAVIAGVFFALDPVLAVVINNGSAILAELNGLRPLLGPGVSPNLSLSLNAETLAAETARLSAQVVPQLASQTNLPLNGHKTKPALARSSKPITPKQQQHSSSPSLSQAKLAQRLGLTSGNLARERLKPEFSEWSRELDPEGLAWSYDANAKLFKSFAKPFLESIVLD